MKLIKKQKGLLLIEILLIVIIGAIIVTGLSKVIIDYSSSPIKKEIKSSFNIIKDAAIHNYQANIIFNQTQPNALSENVRSNHYEACLEQNGILKRSANNALLLGYGKTINPDSLHQKFFLLKDISLGPADNESYSGQNNYIYKIQYNCGPLANENSSRNVIAATISITLPSNDFAKDTAAGESEVIFNGENKTLIWNNVPMSFENQKSLANQKINQVNQLYNPHD